MGGRRTPRWTLGVVSDTHGLLRPELSELYRGVGLILHAGDVGSPEVLAGLAAIAPVRAVRGNVDRGAWAASLPQIEIVEVGPHRIGLVHVLADLEGRPAAAGLSAIVSGHSHVPRIERRGGVLFFNPGSAGPRRFRLPICAGRLHVRRNSIDAELLDLQP